MLKVKVFQWMNLLTLNKGLTLQQDGATGHMAKIVQTWCQRNFTTFWSKEMWPLLHLTLFPWTLGYGQYWSRKPAQCLNQLWTFWRKMKRFIGPNRKRSCSCNLCSSYWMSPSCNPWKGLICRIICSTCWRLYIFLWVRKFYFIWPFFNKKHV